MDDATLVAVTALLASTLRLATPIAFAALGGLISERAGIVNIGLEGMMLTGAFFGVLGSYLTGSAWAGLLTAIVSGGLVAALHAFVCIRLGANQIIAGTAINLLAAGGTSYLLLQLFGTPGSTPQVAGFGDAPIPLLSDIPILGEALFGQSWMVWAAPLSAVALWWALARTTLGLRLRASGEDPTALEAAGVSVLPLRYGAVIVSGVFCGVGGAFLSLSLLTSFLEGMTAGRGYIALAAVIFGAWRPLRAYGAAVLFGFFNALVIRLPQDIIDPQLLQTVPYVATILAMIVVARNAVAPKSSGLPYRPRSGS